ncbi:MAG: class I SAM-dependent methyltransferase [Candidatus Margulisiibacteriota bacterium]
MTFSIERYAGLFRQPETIQADSTWNEHLPFAFFLVELLRPANYVELGVFRGGSYNVFCQAVKEQKTGTKCYGIDTWEGDLHNGAYDLSVYNKLTDYQRKNYAGFSTLLKMPFDEALARFPDGSIDLLHIDGYHTYEAVKHDYESWFPKMSKQGVMLFHDTQIRRMDFGVYKLWGEIAPRYPSLEFEHGCGLGVLAVGPEVSAEFRGFLSAARQNGFFALLFAAAGRAATLVPTLWEKERVLTQINEALTQLEAERKQIGRTVEEQRKLLGRREEQLRQIVESPNWRLAVKLSKLSRLIAPPGTAREKLKKYLAGKLAGR